MDLTDSTATRRRWQNGALVAGLVVGAGLVVLLVVLGVSALLDVRLSMEGEDAGISVRNSTGEPVEITYEVDGEPGRVSPGQTRVLTVDVAESIYPSEPTGPSPNGRGRCTLGPLIARSAQTGDELSRLPAGICTRPGPDNVWYICIETGPRANCPDENNNLSHTGDPRGD